LIFSAKTIISKFKKTEMDKRFDRNDLMVSIDEFYKLYLTRPITDNDGGMKSSHMLPAWFILKTLKPKYIIESGVWKGLGTWLFEKASPESKIISIDPNPQFRIYNSKNSTYQTKDFLETDWNHIDPSETLLFLDDHQNSLERIRHAHKIGIKKVMVEDNYPFCQGDCYSPKKIFSRRKYVIDSAGKKTWYKAEEADYEFMSRNLNVYQEMPPIFIDPTTRWGDEWDPEVYETEEPLLTNELSLKYPTLFEERKSYTWICYMELK
jgi:hypothetical protein